MPNIFTREDLSNVVVSIKEGNVNGTGFFIQDNDKLYLITASHVANITSINCEFILKGADDKPISLKISDLIHGFSAPAIPWRHHTVADICVLDLNINPAVAKNFINRFLPIDNVYRQASPVSRDLELTTIGFPLGYGAGTHFSPLTFRTHAASGFITLQRFDNGQPCDFFILERPSVGGYSGGPVFDISIFIIGSMRSTGAGTMLYGITHGTIFDNTGGKMAAITPSHYLFDLI